MWVLKWHVQSHSTPNRSWTVAFDEEGRWGCNCPQGKYHRDRGPCKHIRDVQAGAAKATKLPSQDPGRAVVTPPSIAPAAVATGCRLRNVKEVYAELRKKAVKHDETQTKSGDAPSHLLEVLED